MPFLRTNEQVNRIVDVVNTVNLYQNYELSILKNSWKKSYFPYSVTDGRVDGQTK